MDLGISEIVDFGLLGFIDFDRFGSYLLDRPER